MSPLTHIAPSIGLSEQSSSAIARARLYQSKPSPRDLENRDGEDHEFSPGR